MDQFDPSHHEDSLNVFAKRGPQDLAGTFVMGRDVPRYVGYEWMEEVVEDTAKYLLDGTTVSAHRMAVRAAGVAHHCDVHLH